MSTRRWFLLIIIIFLCVRVFSEYHSLMNRKFIFSTNQQHVIEGVIINSPSYKYYHLTFEFKLKKMDGLAKKGNLRIGWYGHSPYMHINESWQLRVKLKPISSLRNYPNFNYQHWLRLHNIQAVGYVNLSKDNQKLSKKNTHKTLHSRIQIIREKLNYEIKHALKHYPYANEAGLISAITVGIKTNISQKQWRIFRSTGTSHLMAISGLHIGLAATFIFVLVDGLWRRSRRLPLICPSQTAGYLGALLAAGLYAIISGLALPTQRAVIMISVVTLAKLSMRNISLLRSLLIAFVIIIILEPMALFSASFWLSFAAVACIIYAGISRVNPNANFWWRHGRIQWVISLGLIPLTLWFFQQTSFNSIPANLIAIPTVSFLVVPLSLIGCLISCMSISIANYMFILAAMIMHYLLIYLSYLASFHEVLWHFQLAGFINFCSLLGGTLMILAPRGLPIRWLGSILIFAGLL